MGTKILLSSIATIIGLAIYYAVPAQSRNGYAYGGEPDWRASRPVAVYGYFRGREDRDEDEDEDDVRGYYFHEHYRPNEGRITVVIGNGRYGYYEGKDYGRPPGWDHGRKRGWRGCDLPPGQAKKYGCGDNYVFRISAGR
jgi:hypothetical protein